MVENMKIRAVYAIIAFAAAISTSGAIAKSASGTIQSVDTKHDSILLTDGTKVTLPEGIEAESLKPGENVVVTYTVKNGKLIASSVHPAQ